MVGHKLLIIDSKTGAELLFELISQRYERGSTLITSNLPFDEWTETFGSERLTGALLDRLTHHVTILEMNGDSYRLAQSRTRKTPANALRQATKLAFQANAPWHTPAIRGARVPRRAPVPASVLDPGGGRLLRRPVAGSSAAVDRTLRWTSGPFVRRPARTTYKKGRDARLLTC